MGTLQETGETGDTQPVSLGSGDGTAVSRSVSRTRGAVVNLASSYLGTAVGMVRGLLLVPLYLRSFDLGVYGAWLASGNVLSLVGALEGGLTLVYAQQIAFAQAGREVRDAAMAHRTRRPVQRQQARLASGERRLGN